MRIKPNAINYIPPPQTTAEKLNQKYSQEELRREVERAERDIEREALRNERI